MHIPAADRALDDREWRSFVDSQRFGHMIATGNGRDFPVVAATQFALERDHAIMHFAAPNPILGALAENPNAVLSVAGDWAFIPSDWKAIRAVALGIEEVIAKFKYGGNVDEDHRRAVAERLRTRRGPGDEAAAGHTERRLAAERARAPR